MSGESTETCEVGYGKPPKATRFQKGTSGNPSERPKKGHSATLRQINMLLEVELIMDDG